MAFVSGIPWESIIRGFLCVIIIVMSCLALFFRGPVVASLFGLGLLAVFRGVLD